MPREAVVHGDQPEEERQRDAALRPRWLREVIGQQAVVRRLGIVLNACRKRKEPLSHILFDGPPGLGKTTFATVLPNELGTSIQMTSGPALSNPKDLLPFLTNAEEGSILFIDEIHRMPRVVEEFIYPAMEDFRIDIVLGEGINARTISMRLKRFALIGATTRSGMLSSPMRDRFKMHEHLEFYSVEELSQIVRINSRKLQTEISDDAALELVDPEGLDKQDRRYLETLVGVFDGGPTGVEALAATMNLPVDTLSDEIEPYLLREQFIIRTPRGRVATPRTYQLLGRPPKAGPNDAQPMLF